MITKILIAINLIVFALMSLSGVALVSPEVKDILRWGGNSGYEVLSGEWWRLLTSLFVHIGVIHLLVNMYALFSMGRFLESAIGSYLYFVAYLVSGLLSGVASFLFHQETMIVSAGASGAIAGIFGMGFVVLFTIPMSVEERKKALLNCMYVLFANVMYAFKNHDLDHSAHLGGLACGVVLGLGYYLVNRSSVALRNKSWPHLYSGSALVVTLLVVFATVLGRAPSDRQTFFQLLSKYYEHANNIDTNLPEIETDTTFNFVSTEIEEIKKLLPQMVALNLSGDEELYRNDLAHYSELYVRRFHLMYLSDEAELLRAIEIRKIDEEMDTLLKPEEIAD
ncbi:rhomboid family intramembrane serine protease [Simkania sp.]|uniref:rhomboid family intramembrane serine protease n=1 Tax=Simkania sp. TaxID=34094 RepID=UPI003B521262